MSDFLSHLSLLRFLQTMIHYLFPGHLSTKMLLRLDERCPLDHCNNVRYNVTMIDSFRDTWLRNFFIDDVRHKKIPASIRRSLFRKLQLIDDATCDLDLRSPPSNHFEKLLGTLKGRHSIRINKQWRLIFSWDETTGKAAEIYLDNHDYR